MRPEALFPYFANVTTLPGVGARIAKLIEGLAGPHVIDLLWHLPREIIDRRHRPTINQMEPGRIATVKVHVDRHHPSSDRRRPYRVSCSDMTGNLSLVFFRGDKKWLESQLPVGQERLVSGRVEFFNDQAQIIHPDYIVAPEKADELPNVEPVYPLTTGLTAKVLLKAVTASLGKLQPLDEWQDPAFLKQRGWPAWHEAVKAAHSPADGSDLQPDNQARLRLAYDELLANQLALALMRAQAKRQRGREISGSGALRSKVTAALPFKLTNSQMEALEQIYDDMAAPSRMLRLLQGDVGSGKTVVALMAALNAVESGGQAAIMAPTEILARQHFETIEPLARAAGIEAVVLTGRDKGKARKAVLEKLASGETAIAIGTHALFQEDVEYHDLMLAVIDEQHRFGVHQRLTLASKGKGVDMLVMTATPIPRTLMMTAYGDLDYSRLSEKPAGRKPVKTVVISNERLSEVVAGIGRKLAEGAKVYWVCPLVEESEVSDFAAAASRHEELSQHFGAERVALVHGQMKAADKDAAMASFVDGPAQVLVATTVIEVGVNVPEATVMVIEHAENFGLAQLHQLRGRIGRGEKASTCMLLRAPQLTETARERLSVLSKTEDGFIIAEKDLELRGAGELLGTRQSGLPEMKLADLGLHSELMRVARDDANLILSRDPALESERGQALKLLLYLFERDAAVTNLRSG